ncbi:low molecular weight phosphatase family protein [Agromyces badenianii]|uniref:Low molecular weight phosphatase family protein n=1 Tax=Agromyces badenianii TaxID=2080742 RepID=A0A2S0WY64_9MICO|nr:low molecular weight phosphatase family protein [Agromyces badenianii]AWB96154.1 low molecular weight phosphatase family protein [Agromyces badenianii]
MSFRILTVCTGNICRSPLAEQLLRRELAGIEGVTVASAGTVALVGHGMTPEAQTISTRLGATDASAHVARLLTEQFIAESDLVLGLAREHRRAVVELVPAATRHTFTLREFGRLAASVTDADLDASVSPFAGPVEAGLSSAARIASNLKIAVQAAASLRGVVEPLESPDDADVIDPYGQPVAVYEESTAQLVPALQATVSLLARAAQLTQAHR